MSTVIVHLSLLLNLSFPRQMTIQSSIAGLILEAGRIPSLQSNTIAFHMASTRPLLPAPGNPVQFPGPTGGPIVANGAPHVPLQPEGPPPRKRRHRHTAQEWDQQKQLFTVLYRDNGLSLNEVAKQIEEERGFQAGCVKNASQKQI